MGVKSCAVTSCKNNSGKLKKWKGEICTFHGILQEFCDCAPPFQLFTFPGPVRDPKDREIWVSLIRRKNVDGSDWHPTKEDRVCSDHFLDGMPTLEHPYPEENLGYYLVFKHSRVVKRNFPMSPRNKRPRSEIYSTPAKAAEVDYDHNYSCDKVFLLAVKKIKLSYPYPKR